jgi:hypothetical protein
LSVNDDFLAHSVIVYKIRQNLHFCDNFTAMPHSEPTGQVRVLQDYPLAVLQDCVPLWQFRLLFFNPAEDAHATCTRSTASFAEHCAAPP